MTDSLMLQINDLFEFYFLLIFSIYLFFHVLIPVIRDFYYRDKFTKSEQEFIYEVVRLTREYEADLSLNKQSNLDRMRESYYSKQKSN